MMRFGRILAFVAVISLVFPLACAEEQEPDTEDPRDRFIEILQPTDEQLEQLETGTGTLQLREDQVDTLSDYVTQLLDDLQPWLDEARWQEVKDILEAMLTQGEVDLQTLDPVAEAIHDSLISEAEGGIGVYADLVKLSAEPTPPMKEQSQVAGWPQPSTVVILYTSKDSSEGDKDFSEPAFESEETVGLGGESIGSANPYSGAIGVYSEAKVISGANTYALQRILIEVPVDGTDVSISSRVLYTSGTLTLFPPPLCIAETDIAVAHPYIYPPPDWSYLVIDPWLDSMDAKQLALQIVSWALPFPVKLLAEAAKALLTLIDVLAYQDALEQYGEEEIITYSADSLDAGDYYFRIGVGAGAVSTIGIASAFVFGMIPEIEVTLDIPTFDLLINSSAGGSVIEPGEGMIFTYWAGEEVNLMAEAEEGYYFSNWTEDIGTIGNVNSAWTTITMDDNYSIVALFQPLPT